MKSINVTIIQISVFNDRYNNINATVYGLGDDGLVYKWKKDNGGWWEEYTDDKK